MFPSRFPSSAQPDNNNNARDGGGGGERLRRRNDPRGTFTTHNHRHPPPPVLYTAGILSYKCYGKYHTTSDDRGGNWGCCTGIESQFKLYDVGTGDDNHHVKDDAEREILTRAEALKRFTTLTADLDLGDYQEDNAKSELNQQTRSVLISPVLIYKENEANPNKLHQEQQQETTLPEEDLIRRQDWTCYGKTVVEVLVLEEVGTSDKTIAAVSPKSVGVSFREIETTDDSVRTLTRLGLGWLDIVLDSETRMVDAITAVPSTAGDELFPPSSDDDDMMVTAQKLLRDARDFSGKTYDCSRKIAAQMQYNVQWLNENVRDDFPARTYAAGRQLVATIPTVVELTGKYMAESFRKWMEDDFDDDRDD